MRASRVFFALYICAALFWALRGPLAARLTLRAMKNAGADLSACEHDLQREGRAAAAALREALATAGPEVRLRCARILALQNDPEGDRGLMRLLREYGRDVQNPLGAQAEASLCAAWDQRDAPAAGVRGPLLNIDASPLSETEKLAALNDALAHNAAWASGYVRRARVHQRNGDPLEARRDALIALLLQPSHFEAMLVLASTAMMLDMPGQASLCFEQALRINPRLRVRYKKELGEVQRQLDLEKKRRREELRKDTPIA